jgi:hypothetical protein
MSHINQQKKMKTCGNNVYDVHCQQKLATPHTRDVSGKQEKKKKSIISKSHICEYLKYEFKSLSNQSKINIV